MKIRDVILRLERTAPEFWFLVMDTSTERVLAATSLQTPTSSRLYLLHYVTLQPETP